MVKRLLLLINFACDMNSLQAQNLSGKWVGELSQDDKTSP